MSDDPAEFAAAPPAEPQPPERAAVTPRIALLGLGLGAVFSVVGSLTVVALAGFPDDFTAPVLLAAALVTQLGLLAGCLLALIWAGASPAEGLGWRRVAPWRILVGALGLVCISPLAQVCGTSLWHAAGQSASALQVIGEAVSGLAGPGLIAAALILGLLPGVVEEMLFRGLCQTALARRGLLAIVAPALLFGLYHGDLAQGAAAVVMGLYLGLLRLRTGSVLPCVVAHAANNLIAVAGLGLATAAEAARLDSAPWRLAAGAASVGLVCLLAAGWRRP